MSRTLRAGWACALAVLAAGCQDYNFNPVGHCVIQPGTKRVTLSNVSSADVLFVVDDSRSMSAEQDALAANFSAFINNLDNANAARRNAGLDPFDFHVAVTTTSMFFNYQTNQRPFGPYVCSSSCGGATGQVCCRTDNTPARGPIACSGPGASCPGTTTCGTNCISPFAGEPALKGSYYCCVQGATTPQTAYPAGYGGDVIPCSRVGTECGTFATHYQSDTSCVLGVAADGSPYPQGDFVSWTSGSTANPRVLHFDKSLYPAGAAAPATLNNPCSGTCSANETCVAAISVSGAPRFCRATCTTTCSAGFACVSGACQPVNAQGFTSQALVNFFAGTNANVKVGTCGSGEETPLGAAKKAIEKARDLQQFDTYDAAGTKQWDGTTRTASAPARWFQAGASSKLVVVFVGDEDDCTPTAADASGAVVWDVDDYALGADSCWYDHTRNAPVGGKQLATDAFVDFLTGLGRPVGAGFIFPADGIAPTNSCTLQTCGATAPPNRCCPAGGCTTTTGAQSAGPRSLDTAHKLAAAGADVVAGSICDPNFGTILDDIAEITKPPSGLQLPTMPAADEVTMLRIATADGQTRKVCDGPLQGTYLTVQEAQNAINPATGRHWDWWFTVDANPKPPAAVVTTFVYINPIGGCTANPGETYSADYIGRLPEGGCGNDTVAGVTGDQMCERLLGGGEGSWTCYAGTDASGKCAATTGTWNGGVNPTGTGSCICGSATRNCPGGRL